MRDPKRRQARGRRVRAGLMGRILFITGTDTGVGKTELAVLLARFLRSRGVRFRAVKPFCSGGRGDVLRLAQAQGVDIPRGKIAARHFKALAGQSEPNTFESAIEEITPWYFKEPLTPLVAARMEGRRCDPRRVVSWLRERAANVDVLVVEGAGGLLSPLAAGLDSRRLIVELRAMPVIVCPDRLGAINQILLTLEALPAGCRRRAIVVLVDSARPDPSAATNQIVAEEWLGRGRILRLPRLSAAERRGSAGHEPPSRCVPLLETLAKAVGW